MEVDNLCQASNQNKAFSIRFENSYLTDDNSGATLLSQEIALVICGSQTPSTSYTCYSSDSTVVIGPTVSLLPPPPNSYHITAIVVPIAIIIVVLVAVLVVVLVIVYLRYSRLKAEPPRMCPIESATASLIAGTLAPFGLEPTENSNLEFPRENLQFVKVLGQ